MTDASTWTKRLWSVAVLLEIARHADVTTEIGARRATVVALLALGVTADEMARCCDQILLADSMDPEMAAAFLFPGDAS